MAQVLIRDSELAAAIRSAPWTGRGGFSWKDARSAEYRDPGPGAAVTADRPESSAADARGRTVAAHLVGPDGRDPYARTH